MLLRLGDNDAMLAADEESVLRTGHVAQEEDASKPRMAASRLYCEAGTSLSTIASDGPVRGRNCRGGNIRGLGMCFRRRLISALVCREPVEVEARACEAQ